MSSLNLSFNCVLITGGGGGLGRAMAEYFVSLGKKVIIVGRTESNLVATAKDLGSDTAYYVLDTGHIDAIPAFVERVLKEHPEVDCIVNNAGVQRPLLIQNFDLDKADEEININIRGPMHLSIRFLDHLKAKPNGGIIMNVSSVLGYCPTSLINPVYNGTKAWVHFWTMVMRTQLQDTKVRLVEIAPPSVGTDLHRERENPDDNKGGSALTVEQFMKEVSQGFEEGKDTISAGPGVALVEKWYQAFGEQYAQAERTRRGMPKW